MPAMVESGHGVGLLPGPRLPSKAPVDFVTALVIFAIFTTVALLWARLSKLDLGLTAPAWRRAEPWILLYVLWGIAEWAIAIFVPTGETPDLPTRMDQLSLAEDLIVSVLLLPVSEELLFRGAMFAAFLRRWGIWAAALVPSLIWGLLHSQYEWWVMASVAGSGILLAMVRWKGGSLYLPIGLHATGNLLATLNIHGLFGPVT